MSDTVGTIDPNSILFSLPTLCDTLAATDPVSEAPVENDVVFHEDDWRQIEFYALDRLEEIQGLLNELHAFEQEHRQESGWSKIFIRPAAPSVLLAEVDEPLAALRALLGTVASEGALYLFGGQALGRVRNGFSLNLGGNIALYGTCTAGGLACLAAAVGRDPDHTVLTEAFVKIVATVPVILVDWCSQMILLKADEGGAIRLWRP